MKIERILVPVDFSTMSTTACRAAAEIARKNAARVHLLHVMDIDMEDTPDEGDKYEEHVVKSKLQSLAAQDFFHDVDIVRNVEHGMDSHRISDIANMHAMDLIVMGSQGDKGLHETLVGSHSEKVIRRSFCPVLVIKEENSAFNPRTVVFASDFYEYDIEAFKKEAALVKLFGAEIHLMKVVTPVAFENGEEIEQRMKEFSRKTGIEPAGYHIYTDDSVENGILRFARTHECDLIAVETHGREGAKRWFLGNITENLANHSRSTPILSVRMNYTNVDEEYGVERLDQDLYDSAYV